MVDEKALLLELGDVFPTVGAVVPFVELKFRLAGKYTTEGLEGMLTQLVEKDILGRFEFNNSVNYKCKGEIPLSVTAKAAPTPASGSSNGSVDDQRIRDLETIVFALGGVVKDLPTQDLISKYQATYK